MRKLIHDFGSRCRLPELWPCPRSTFAEQLRKRIGSPRINQGHGTYLCGTASVVQQLLRASLYDFIKFAIDLYETGSGKFLLEGRDVCLSVIKTDAMLRQVNPFAYDGLAFSGDWVDWIVLSSIRYHLSQNSPVWFRSKNLPYDRPVYSSMLGLDWLDVAKNFLRASALPEEVEQMLQWVGFSVVQRDTNNIRPKDINNLKRAAERNNSGFHVNLYVNSAITRKYGQRIFSEANGSQKSFTATHWIVVSSHIDIDEANKKVTFSYVDYGTEKACVEFPLDAFLGHYFGFVAACR
ncbi:hypothetical protein WME88_58065 [Sorangium sp. So ce216]